MFAWRKLTSKSQGLSLIALFTVLVLTTLKTSAQANLVLQDRKSAESSTLDQPIKNTNVSYPQQYLAFQHIVYHYFQKDYLKSYTLIERGLQSHAFADLNQANKDRLKLMLGACQLQLGLLTQAQQSLQGLLSQSSSKYVQANTLFWLAKLSYETQQLEMVENAYDVIHQDKLFDHLEENHWQQLVYFRAHTNLLAQQPWQQYLAEFRKHSIYPVYLYLSHGSIAYNNSDYIEAKQAYLSAKMALTDIKQSQSSVLDMFTLPLRSLFNYSQFKDKSANDRLLIINEQDALFDEIKLNLSYTLIKLSNYDEALKTAGSLYADGSHSGQGLMALGSAFAQLNDWQSAISIWEMIKKTSDINALHAQLALVYAHQQQNAKLETFIALETAINSLRQSIDTHQAFQQQIHEPLFFENMHTLWPEELGHLKTLFINGYDDQSQSDISYLIAIRRQALEIQNELKFKQENVAILNNMLLERKSSFEERSKALSLEQAKQIVQQTQSKIDQIHQALQASSLEEQGWLNVSMLSSENKAIYSRLLRARERFERLSADESSRKKLRASVSERLRRLEGILEWEMVDTYQVKHWKHKKQLLQLESLLAQVRQTKQSIEQAKQNDRSFDSKERRFADINRSIKKEQKRAESIIYHTEGQLRTYLDTLIQTQIKELNTHWINARLMKIQIQDQQQTDQTDEFL